MSLGLTALELARIQFALQYPSILFFRPPLLDLPVFWQF